MRTWMRRAGERLSGSTLGDAFTVAYQTRIPGLASEASFWGLFALPWLFLALVAGIAHIESFLGVDAVDAVRDEMLQLAEGVLTAEAIDELLVPLLDSILLQGRTGLGLLGVVAAVWAGSRVIDTLVEGMTIVYGREGLRSFVKTRVVSVLVYAGAMLGLIVTIPLVLAGPTFLARVLPGTEGLLTSVVLGVAELVVVLVLLVSIYHWSVPHRTPWAADLPGAVIAMVLWAVFSYLLRWYFLWMFREGSVYGVISAPIAVMMWAYVTCVALLLGAAFNGALAVRRGWFTPVEDTGGPGAASSSA
jgi:membrane protein